MSFNPRANTVTGLPARTGIVELMLFYPRAPSGPPVVSKNRKVTVKAKPSAAGAAGRPLKALLRSAGGR